MTLGVRWGSPLVANPRNSLGLTEFGGEVILYAFRLEEIGRRGARPVVMFRKDFA